MNKVIIGSVLLMMSLTVDIPNGPTFPEMPFKVEEAGAENYESYTIGDNVYVQGDNGYRGNSYTIGDNVYYSDNR